MTRLETILARKVKDWGEGHLIQESSLTEFLFFYGAALARFGEPDVLGTVLTRTYERTAAFNRVPFEDLMEWMFRPDDAEDVAWRMQLATNFANTINLEA